METAGWESLVIVCLILVNGALVASEIALVSSRRARLQRRAEEGDRGARVALGLVSEPKVFLSTIQIGITLIGVLAAAFGGSTVAEALAAVIVRVPSLAHHAHAIALGTVVLGITLLTLLLGELVPKRIGMTHPERIAAATSLPVRWLTILAAPAVWFLNALSDAVLFLLRVKPSKEPPVTEEELKILIEQGTQAGTFERAERDMLHRVLRLGDRQVSSLMTPRADVVWLDAGEAPAALGRKITESLHSRFPVCRGGLDDIIGVIQSKDILAASLAGQRLDLRRLMKPPLFVPEGTPAMKVLETFRGAPVHLALIVDEYGSLKGVVTPNDMLSSVVGELSDHPEDQRPEAVRREDGSWLVDGMMPVDEFREVLRLSRLPGEDKGYYRTVGGFAMMQLGRIPRAADHFDWNGYRVEVLDMDGRRVDKVLVVPPPEPDEEQERET